MLEEEYIVWEGKRGALGKIIQGRKREGPTTYSSFPEVQKAYDTAVWRTELWKRLRKYVENDGKYEGCARIAVMLGGKNIELCLLSWNELHRDTRKYYLVYLGGFLSSLLSFASFIKQRLIANKLVWMWVGLGWS